MGLFEFIRAEVDVKSIKHFKVGGASYKSLGISALSWETRFQAHTKQQAKYSSVYFNIYG
jgi:hypothetical protein